MKKTILILSVIFSFAVLFTACKETKKEEKTKMESHENHDHSSDEEMASKDVYQCPMDCEKGKTYDETGSCPVCKMDLKTKAVDSDVKHAEGCKCIEGGECKCEDGKCTCQKEMAKMEKECTMCAPGSCDCKA